jgi:hypothetical protein
MLFLSAALSNTAYLDPGSGSILIQLLLAAILGLGVMFRSQLAKLKNLFGIKSESKDDEDTDDEE